MLPNRKTQLTYGSSLLQMDGLLFSSSRDPTLPIKARTMTKGTYEYATDWYVLRGCRAFMRGGFYCVLPIVPNVIRGRSIRVVNIFWNKAILFMNMMKTSCMFRANM